MAHKRWIVASADKEIACALSEKFDIDPFLSFLLVSRGLKDESSVSSFITNSITLFSPFDFTDMQKAVGCINAFIESGELICIYGDYDCDGVTSTALLYSLLESLGANVIYYIPKRDTEGYGMNKESIKLLSEKGVKLIITVDNGISSIDEAKFIYENNMKLIITDHHKIGDELPMAEAVVNPHRDEDKLSFYDYAGVGVAFKLACAIYGSNDEMLEQFADLVALGTVGDLMPLQSENRSLVKAGLQMINNNERLGINALKKVSSLTNNVTATDIAFKLSPRINAAGRMSNAYMALELLITDDEEIAINKANGLTDENSHRQELEKNIIDDIEKRIKNDKSLVDGRVIVVSGKNYHLGVIGIVASHLVEKYSKPAIVISIDENGECSGSCRSVEGFDIYNALSNVSDVLTRFGGHPLAAGIGLYEKDIDEFRDKINFFSYDKYPSMPEPKLYIDCKIALQYLSLDLAKSLKMLEPCGIKNKNAIFGLFGVKITNIIEMGEGKHLRIEVQKKDVKISIVKFRTTLKEFAYKIGDIIDTAVTVSENNYNNRTYLSVKAVDIRLHGIDDDKYFSEKNDFEDILNKKTPSLPFYPNRKECSVIYKYLKSNNGFTADFDSLYFILQKYDITYSQLHFALKAFEESGLISIDEENQITLREVTTKTNLENTSVLTALKG